MIVTNKSMFTGKISSMDLPITKDQLYRWQTGELVQNVFPHLSKDEREFLMTGVTPDEWEATFGKEE